MLYQVLLVCRAKPDQRMSLTHPLHRIYASNKLLQARARLHGCCWPSLNLPGCTLLPTVEIADCHLVQEHTLKTYCIGKILDVGIEQWQKYSRSCKHDRLLLSELAMRPCISTKCMPNTRCVSTACYTMHSTYIWHLFDVKNRCGIVLLLDNDGTKAHSPVT